MKDINLERLKDLVLARLSVGPKKPPSRSDLTKVLYPLVRRRSSMSEWNRLLDRALGDLRASAMVDPERLVITAEGAARLKSALGSKGAPSARDWREFKRKYLPRLAFESLPAVREAGVRPSAAVLAQRLGVVPKPPRSSKSKPEAEVVAVIDTWLCASLGLPPQPRLSFNALRGALLARELGLPPRPLDKIAGVAVATLSEATSGKDDAVSEAFTLRWLFDEPPPVASQAPPAPRQAIMPAVPNGSAAPAVPAAPGVSAVPLAPTSPSEGAAHVERIAAMALQAACGPDAHQFGPNKVFIGSVWRALAADPEIAGLGEVTFKRQLAEAHRRGLLQLGRADLVAAMDPKEVSASEIVHQNATYHFILRGASA